MKIETYRGALFMDREEEIEFFVDWFDEVPQKILVVDGPKSSGKTTVIEYVVENILLRGILLPKQVLEKICDKFDIDNHRHGKWKIFMAYTWPQLGTSILFNKVLTFPK